MDDEGELLKKKREKMEEEEELAHETFKGFFKAKKKEELHTEIVIRDTLGQGTYGRVRLVQSAEAGSALTEARKRTLTDQQKKDPDFRDFLEPMGPQSFALKILKKSEIIRLKQVEHVKHERSLLLETSHPFIQKAYRTYADDRNLYLLTEYVPGGELLSRCRARDSTPPLDDKEAQFYAAQLVMALQYLHSDMIIYRGLVPDNILIDKQGYLKLVDFGFAKKLKDANDCTYTLCGTPDYLAPEIVSSKGHGKGADWWALGVIIYEMLSGYTPFYAEKPFDIYKKILEAKPTYPNIFDPNLAEGVNISTGEALNSAPQGLLPRLMRYTPPGPDNKPKASESQRMGCQKGGPEEIKKHKWFRGLNWAKLYNRQVTPPWRPMLKSEEDTSHFADYRDSLEESGPFLEQGKQDLFKTWDNFDPTIATAQ